MLFELATLFFELGFNHGQRDLCLPAQGAPAAAAEPEVAFLVHNLCKAMMKVVIF